MFPFRKKKKKLWCFRLEFDDFRWVRILTLILNKKDKIQVITSAFNEITRCNWDYRKYIKPIYFYKDSIVKKSIDKPGSYPEM